MIFIKLTTFVFVSFFTASLFAAGNSLGGQVAHIASVDDAILFKIVGNSETDRPACATTKRFSVHKDSVHAPLVLMAFATGKTLNNVRGLGTCNLWGNSEDLRYIEICPTRGC